MKLASLAGSFKSQARLLHQVSVVFKLLLNFMLLKKKLVCTSTLAIRASGRETQTYSSRLFLPFKALMSLIVLRNLGQKHISSLS